ncbi:MAG TPA: hypothetical protein VNA13_04060, partial [Xanthomonadales bacterium]|nr:hypothetical protein [Xanthomonadales bacterium]
QHENVISDESPDIDAVFLFDDEGKGPKEWQIIDWDPKEKRSLAGSVRAELLKLGVENVQSLVFINDTSAVSLDKEAEYTAVKMRGYEFFPNGNVGGSGTNSTLRGVNTEIGHSFWPTDAIYERMKANGWTQNERPELETETGQYLALRLAAGVQILGEYGFDITPDERTAQLHRNTQEIVDDILRGAENDPAYISRLARGEINAESVLVHFANRVLKRAGQVYGIMYAATAEAMLGEREPEDVPAGMLTEGSVIHKGHLIKSMAEVTAKRLGQPIRIVEASGAKGVTYLAMAKPHLQEAA